jgi:hypothetical protein
VSASTPLTLRRYDSGWEAEDRGLHRRTLNRQKLLDMRKDIKGFTESVEALIKITDGWMHSTGVRHTSEFIREGAEVSVLQ